MDYPIQLMLWLTLGICAVAAYAYVGYSLLNVIEKRIYEGEPPTCYRGFWAGFLQAGWPLTLTLMALIGCLTRPRPSRRARRKAKSCASTES